MHHPCLPLVTTRGKQEEAAPKGTDSAGLREYPGVQRKDPLPDQRSTGLVPRLFFLQVHFCEHFILPVHYYRMGTDTLLQLDLLRYQKSG